MKKINLFLQTILLLFIVTLKLNCTNPHGNDDPFFDTLIASVYSGYKLTYVIDGMIDSSNFTLQQAHIIFQDYPFFTDTAKIWEDTIKLGGYESDSGYVHVFYRFQVAGIDSINLFEMIHSLGDTCVMFPIDLTLFGSSESFIMPYYKSIETLSTSIKEFVTLGKLNCDSLINDFLNTALTGDTLELFTCLLQYQ